VDVTYTGILAKLNPTKDLSGLLRLGPTDERGLVDPAAMQSKVVALQDELLNMPQAEVETVHTFLPGIYERKIIVPPWTVLTGAEHKTDYKVRLEKGTIAVNVDDKIRVLTAPCEFVAKAGAQRAGRVFDEEVVWVDVYENIDDCTDISTLENRLYVVPECGLADSRTEVQKAKIDFNAFLHQIGTTQNKMDAIVHITSDLIDMPEGVAVELRNSPIHGKGLFTTKNFCAGETVCPGRLNGKRTPGGRFINHSPNCNAVPVKVDDDIYVVAVTDIRSGEELLVDYRTSMKVNFGLAY
jgi:hypothetical protein